MAKYYTTLNKIRAHGPCVSGWKKLLSYLGKTEADDVELDLMEILKSNGLDDTVWCARAVDNFTPIKDFVTATHSYMLLQHELDKKALEYAYAYAYGDANVYANGDANAYANAYAYAYGDADGDALVRKYQLEFLTACLN